MTLTIGTGTFDIAYVDYKLINHNLHLLGGFLGPATPLEKASRDLSQLRVRKVAEYDCKTRTVNAFHTLPNGKLWLSPWVTIIGLNAQGRNTGKADKALADSFAKASGKLVVTDTVADIFKLFGERTLDIPIKDYLAEFGADKSWSIYLAINWVMVQVMMPKGAPKGLICIGVPYDMRFSGSVTFDCKRGRPPRLDEARSFETGFQGFPVRSPAVRTFAVGDLDERIKQAEGTLKWLKQQAAITREMFPDPEQAWGIKRSDKRAIKRAKAEVDRLTSLRKEMATQ
ncbi:MAG: hypothetical protein AAFY38_15470 [Pseudomonadota bacterium]